MPLIITKLIVKSMLELQMLSINRYKVSLSLTCLFFLISSISGAQTDTTYKEDGSQKNTNNKRHCFIIKSNILELSLNVFKVNVASLTLEKGFRRWHSVQLSGTYRNYYSRDSYDWQLVPEYKFYWNTNENFKGFYTGVYLKHKNEVYTNKYVSPMGSKYNYLIRDLYISKGAGLIIGYQTYIKKHFTLDFLIGGGAKYIIMKNIESTNIISVGTSGNYPITEIDGRLAIHLGYKF